MIPMFAPFIRPPGLIGGGGGGSFPVIESIATHAQTSDSSSWASLTMPSGIVAGDKLIAIMACDSAIVSVSFDSTAATGWTRPRYASNGVTTSFAYKEADGGGTDDLSITLGKRPTGGCRNL